MNSQDAFSPYSPKHAPARHGRATALTSPRSGMLNEGALVWAESSPESFPAKEAHTPQMSPRWLSIEWLPAYAPDLNPVEAMWSYTKHADLANFLPRDLGELEEALLDSVVAQRYDRRLKESFFQTAQLDL